ncbi:MAG: hypothetical protein HPY74_04730 [Firmicutes bacterium]|nr:hypothetical protein [Bacillota bacterium]
MVNKYFKKRMNVSMKDYLPDFKGPISLEYYLLECEDYENTYEFGPIIGYGVEVVKVFKNEPVESKSFKNITHCKDTAVNIIDVLAENTVTPIELPYVLDNIIGL